MTKLCVCVCVQLFSVSVVVELLGRHTEVQRGMWSHAAEAELQNHDLGRGGEWREAAGMLAYRC